MYYNNWNVSAIARVENEKLVIMALCQLVKVKDRVLITEGDFLLSFTTHADLYDCNDIFFFLFRVQCACENSHVFFPPLPFFFFLVFVFLCQHCLLVFGYPDPNLSGFPQVIDIGCQGDRCHHSELCPLPSVLSCSVQPPFWLTFIFLTNIFTNWWTSYSLWSNQFINDKCLGRNTVLVVYNIIDRRCFSFSDKMLTLSQHLALHPSFCA